MNADLEKSVRVTSRNELIVNVLEGLFHGGRCRKTSGNYLLYQQGAYQRDGTPAERSRYLSAGLQWRYKTPGEGYAGVQEHKIRFLCACDMISEGWDYPNSESSLWANPVEGAVSSTDR